jgi:hypothetical protein
LGVVLYNLVSRINSSNWFSSSKERYSFNWGCSNEHLYIITVFLLGTKADRRISTAISVLLRFFMIMILHTKEK